jgi:transposase
MGKVARSTGAGQTPDDGTIYVGCDIGSVHHSASIIDGRGNVLEKIDRVHNNIKGFRFLLGRINNWRRRTGAASVRFGFEPTGHYWKTIVNFMREHGIEVFFIKTTAVKAMRELTDSTPSKNDRRDALTLAHLLREGKVLKSKPPQGVFRELRDLAVYRQRVMEARSACLLRLRALLDTFFPELLEVFSDMTAVGLRRLLEEAPFPADLSARGPEWLTVHLKRWTRRGKSAEEKARALMEAAGQSAGLPILAGDRIRLQSIARTLELHTRELTIIEREMERALMESGYGELLLSFPGIGVVSAATFLGELGDPANFENANQWVSMAGIDPSENSSGTRQGRKRISKKGRPILRLNLYFMALCAIRNCPELRAYYLARKKDIEEGRLDIVPNQLVFAVAIKQLRMLFAMLRDKRAYEPGRIELRKAA